MTPVRKTVLISLYILIFSALLYFNEEDVRLECEADEEELGSGDTCEGRCSFVRSFGIGRFWQWGGERVAFSSEDVVNIEVMTETAPRFGVPQQRFVLVLKVRCTDAVVISRETWGRVRDGRDLLRSVCGEFQRDTSQDTAVIRLRESWKRKDLEAARTSWFQVLAGYFFSHTNTNLSPAQQRAEQYSCLNKDMVLQTHNYVTPWIFIVVATSVLYLDL